MERKIIQACMKELLDAELVKLTPSHCEYTSAMARSSHNNMYKNWIKKPMYGDYYKINNDPIT